MVHNSLALRYNVFMQAPRSVGDSRILTSLHLRNFRAFEDQTIDFAPITILVGPNNAGKSSILGAVRLLAQTVDSPDWDIPLLLKEFGTFRDVIFGNKVNRILGFTFGFSVGSSRPYLEVNFKYRAQRREIILRDFTLRDDQDKPLFKTGYSRDTERQSVRAIPGVKKEITQKLTRPLRVFHFLPRVMPVKWELDRLKKEQKFSFSYIKNLYEVDQISRKATWLLQSIQYIGPFREAPLRVYPFSGERPSKLGPSGSGATDILVADFFRRGTRKRELSNLVRDWLAKARIANELQILALGDRHYEIKLQHPTTMEIENLADVGYGISQVLPVVVAGYNMEPNSIYMVEEPEIHLHPAAQSELGDFFLELYKKHVQCIVETHSEHLITRLQKHVAAGEIPPEDIVVNYVAAGKRAKEVTKLTLGKDGLFVSPWPGGFFEERLGEALELARAPLKRDGQL